MALLSVNNLRTCFYTREGTTVAVNNVSFSVDKGKVIGIVGESGSGKSVACYSLLGLIPSPPGKIESGSAIFDGVDLLALSESELRRFRGNRISMVFQDPMTSLNPFMRVGDQLTEALRCHHKITRQQAKEKAIQALEEVGIVNARERIDAYPYEFSGGMRQRVMIAMALISEPDLLIADEPTTALDVTVQKQILKLIKDLQSSRDLGVIFITHDLGVVAEVADNIIVMKNGEIVEAGTPEHIFTRCTHPYTRKLIDAIPGSAKPEAFTYTRETSDFVDVKNLVTHFPIYGGGIIRQKIIDTVKAVDDISLNIREGEIFGLVGESGSGKSTLGRSIIRLIESQSGSITINGLDVRGMDVNNLRRARREFQMIFQDPYASLNPRMTVFDTIAEPLLLHKLATRKDLLAKVNVLMDEVGLERLHIRKYPHEFSGGQRQRIAIARALAVQPKFIVADEPVSALDVTIQAQILDLLLELTHKHGLTMLFISHDLSVVRYICDRVAVMQKGKIVEVGETEALFSSPAHQYTEKLLSAIPNLSKAEIADA